jgi:5-methyltetrahydropteroyltriglutamate--homocysteine methyltransferase
VWIGLVETYDTGSMPFVGDFEQYLKAASAYAKATSFSAVTEDLRGYFDGKVEEGFLAKRRAGIDIPNYPQFRDMSEMFLEVLTGIGKIAKGYAQTDSIRVKAGLSEIPEVAALRRNAKRIAKIDDSPVRLKVSITGPYTLASMLSEKYAETFTNLADVLSTIVDANIFVEKYGEVKLLFIEEPLFGLVDDPLLDFGQKGRESILHAWEHILSAAKSKGVQTGIHLHSTNDGLFWDVKGLDIVESHVVDPFYESVETRKNLQKTDKFAKASIAVTDFDNLIRNRIAEEGKNMRESAVNDRVGDFWNGILENSIDPLRFLEEINLMKKRLETIIRILGSERVPYAGPECGLKGFPNIVSATELLRRVAEAAHSI